MFEYERLELPTIGELIDVALRLCLIERVFALNLRHEIVAFDNQGEILVAQGFTLLHPLRQCIQRGRRHTRHPFRIFSHCVSATLAACGVVEIFFGHGLVKPSLGHFRVASMPILLP